MTMEQDFPPGIAFRTPDRANCDEAAMVLEAVGIDSEVLCFDSEFLLVVRPEDEFEARRQLALYMRENREVLEDEHLFPPFSRGIHGTALYVALLILVDGLTKGNVFGQKLLETGRANAGLIMQGEWWRAITALMLHADIVHLSGNIAFGSIFGLLVCQSLGPGMGWFSIVMSGAVGNILSASLQTEMHTSIGASTAVFGALGILSGHTCVFWHRLSGRKMRRWAPLTGGVMLLAFLGGPGPRIDVLSHVTGFLTGSIVGVLFGIKGHDLRENGKWQIISGVLTLLIVGISWWIAVSNLT